MTGGGSPTVTDYDERPADGWDIRAEGWLPAYPQLGGKLVYQQYYGNEVALFGESERQKNPHAITAGVTWTPFYPPADHWRRSAGARKAGLTTPA
ncbi:inverse autotransporter beta domain-containing protein [Escherichia coli]